MIAHVVLFKLRANLGADERSRLADTFASALRAIPSIRRAQVGPRITLGRGYERLMHTDYGFAAVLEFDDIDGLTAYLEHPLHAELGSRFFGASEDTLAYDFAFEEGAAGLETLRARADC